jgi:Autographiviridae endonuclease
MSDRTAALLAHGGNVLRVEFRPKTDRESRFFAKVDKGTGEGCWIWTGGVTQSNGYGQYSDVSPITCKRTMRGAHRVAYELEHGVTLKPSERILHAKGCCQRCVRPDHLRIGTAAENTADAKAEGRLKTRKLDAGKVLEIVALHKRYGLKAWVLAQRFGVSNVTINSILRGKTWASVTGIVYQQRKPGRPRKLVEEKRLVA